MGLLQASVRRASVLVLRFNPIELKCMFKKLFSVTTAFIVLATSCKKNGDDKDAEPTLPPIQKVTIDTTRSKLLSTADELGNGLFRYNSLPGSDSIKRGALLIDPRNNGYLRKVDTVMIVNNGVVVHSTQGTLDELFRDSGAVFRYVAIPEAMKPFRKIDSSARVTTEVNDVELSGDDWKLKFNKLKFSFDPNFVFELSVKDKVFKMGFVDAATVEEYNVDWILQAGEKKVEDTFALSKMFPAIMKFNKIPFTAPGIIGHIKVDLMMKIKLSGNLELQSNINYAKQTLTNAFVDYRNSKLSAEFNYNNPVFTKKLTVSLMGNANLSMELYPVFTFHIYNVPLVDMGVKGILDNSIRYNGGKGLWDAETSYGGAIFGSLNNSLLSFLSNKEFSKEIAKVKIFEAPKALQVVSGANQTAVAGQALRYPIALRVLDSDGNPQGPVNVYFTSSSGKWSKDLISTTPITGNVSNTFTLANSKDPVTLTATIKNAVDSVVAVQTIQFTPKDQSQQICNGFDVVGWWNTLDASVQRVFNESIGMSGTTLPDEQGLTRLFAKGSLDLRKKSMQGKLVFPKCFSTLTELILDSNDITELDVKDLPNLQSLYCNWNKLTSASYNKATIKDLSFYSNQLTNVDVANAPQLRYLEVSANKLESLNVSGSTELTYISCWENRIKSLNCSGLTKLNRLQAYQNWVMADLNVNGLSNLVHLSCEWNNLKTLNLSGLSKLEALYCHQNKLENLNISTAPKLGWVSCAYNELKSITVGNLDAMKEFNCEYNYLGYEGLMPLMKAMPATVKFVWGDCNTNRVKGDNGPNPDNPGVGSDCWKLIEFYEGKF
jgi:hypothetical protein